MNTNVKTKINRLGLVGVIISILLIISTVINFGLVTRTSIRNLSSNDTESYGTLEQSVLQAIVDGEDTAIKIETDEGIRYELTYDDGDEMKIFSYTKDGETYEIDVPTNDQFTLHLTEQNPERALADYNAQAFFRNAYQIAMIVSAAFSIVVFVFLLLAADAFRRCNSPFEDRVISRMNVFAWVLLANALFNLMINVASELFARIVYSGHIVGAFTESGILESVLYLVTPSFPLVVSLIVLFLVRVFRHGAELQKESDETL